MAEREQPSPNEKLEYIELRRLYDEGLRIVDEFMDKPDEVRVILADQVVEVMKSLGDPSDSEHEHGWLKLVRERVGTTHVLYVSRITQTPDGKGGFDVAAVTYSLLAMAVERAGGIVHGSRWSEGKQVLVDNEQTPPTDLQTPLNDEGALLNPYMTLPEVRVVEAKAPILPQDGTELRGMLHSWYE